MKVKIFLEINLEHQKISIFEPKSPIMRFLNPWHRQSYPESLSFLLHYVKHWPLGEVFKRCFRDDGAD